MSARHLTSRVIRRALGVVDQMPAEALAELVEALIAKLDAAGPDPDCEPEPEVSRTADDVPIVLDAAGDPGDAEDDDSDCCSAADDDMKAFLGGGFCGAGDLDDAEDSGDREPSDVEAPQHFGREVLGMESWTGAGLA